MTEPLDPVQIIRECIRGIATEMELWPELLTTPELESARAAALVMECDAMQLLSRAAWHITPKRKLHDRPRGNNLHPEYWTYDEPRLFMDVTFDRFAPQGGV